MGRNVSCGARALNRPAQGRTGMADRPLTRGDRAPNFFLADHRDVIISLYDKVKGGPIIIFFYPSRADAAAEVEHVLALAKDIAEAGAHLFLVGGDAVSELAAPAAALGEAGFVVFDDDAGIAAAYGVGGLTTAFLLDPNARVLARFAAGDTPLAERALEAAQAARPSEPQTLTMHPPILIIPDVLDRDFCRYLIEQYYARGNEESGTFRVVDGKMIKAPNYAVKRRRDHHVVDRDLLDKIGGMISRRVLPEIQRAFHCNITRVEEFKIVCYQSETGGYFYIHRDNTTPQTAHRRFAMTLILNDEEFEGGYLRFPEFGNVRYKPPTGAAVVFSCNLLHELGDVTKGTRFVLLSFIFDEAGQKQLTARQAAMARRRALRPPPTAPGSTWPPAD